MSGRTVDYRAFGAIGEELACQFLRRMGFKILTRNYVCPLGEIDLIARDGQALVFVEVKSRRTLTTGEPFEQVTHHKRRQIVRCAKYYMARFGVDDILCRFDAVSVKMEEGSEAVIEVIHNAFGAGSF